MNQKNDNILEFVFSPDIEEKTSAKLVNIKREHEVETFYKFDATLMIRFWIKVGIQIVAVIVKSGDKQELNPFYCSLVYERDDATQAIKTQAIGVTLLIASKLFKEEGNPEISIIFNTKERLLIKNKLERVHFDQLIEGVNFDVSRMKGSFESFTYTQQGKNLVNFISGAWQLYLQKQKNSYVINSTKSVVTRPLVSIVTVFYKNTQLASIYPLLTSIFKLGEDFEIIMCFQEANIFKNQIEWLKFIATKINVNLKIIMIEENIGFSAANNIGVENSNGETVILLNPDIICADINIFKKISTVSKNKKAIIGATLLSTAGDVMHNGIEFESELSFENKKPFLIKRTYHVNRHISKNNIRSHTLKNTSATTGALISVSRKIWDDLGGLSERYVYAHFEDVDFCYRAKMLGVPCFIYQNQDLIHIESYSSGDNGMSMSLKLVNSSIYNNLQG